MKNIYLLILLMLIVLGLSAKTYTVVCEEYPPYEYLENGKPTGLDIEILQAVAQKAGIEFKYNFVPWERALYLTKNKQADAIISLFKTAEREEFLLFPEEGLAYERNVIFAKENYNREINKIDDLKNLTIGVTSGYSYGPEFDDYVGVNKDFSNDQDTMIRKFANNRFEIFITNELVGHYLLKKQGVANYKTLGYVADDQMLYMGISKGMADSEILYDKVNTALKELKQSGELDAIRKKYTATK